MKQTTLCLISALGGAMVGAAIAMLTTPHSGREMRGKIYEALSHMAEHGYGCHCHKGEGDAPREAAPEH